jgi:lysozyme family protein
MALSTKEVQIRVAGYAADGPERAFVAIDGVSGPQTRAAIMRFQQARGLAADGIVGPQTTAALESLAKPDQSTEHFDWDEFDSGDGQGFAGGRIPAAEVKANVRRLMWKLEALRHKAGDRAITINSGFRSVAHNSAVGGARNSQHMYGIAADISAQGLSPAQVRELAKSCGFSGIKAYPGHSHVDSRAEHSYNSGHWWWPS